MGHRLLLGIVSTLLLVGVTAPACGDAEQEPTGSTTPSTGGSGATGGGGAGATGGGGHAAHGGGGGTAGEGGTGGTGGGPECTIAADCGPSSDCAGWTCEAGKCDEVIADPGKLTSSQVTGDCKTNTCGGPIDEATDPFDDQNDCTADTCAAGSPVNDAEPIGTSCASNGGKLCDGEKNCVECLMDGDCLTGICTATNTCAPAECGDGQKNGTETDVDCGGPVCAKCDTDEACLIATDCQSSVCDPTTKVCNAPTCLDGVKNQNESDVDCGVVCNVGCSTGDTCTTPADCASLVCSGMPLTCQMATCSDNVKNGTESDVDCGGTCPDCPVGDLCGSGADCESGVCSGTPATCQMPSCSDNVKNGTESAVDCGGTCPDCLNDQPCNVDTDCQSGFCNAAKVCKTPTCTDNAKNGTETDIDCGGTCPANCMNGQTCTTGADCQSTFCAGTPLTCQPTLNGCAVADFVDLTNQSTVNVNFGSFFYTPKCIKVSPGTQVTWSGELMFHPLQGGTVINFMATPDNSQIPLTNTGTSKTIAFPTAGIFPYYCQFHINSMQGVVQVVP